MNKTYLPSVKRTLLSFLSVLFLLIVLLITSFYGLFIHTLMGSVLLFILAYLTSQRVRAKAITLKRKRENYIKNYMIGEKYLSVFSVENQESYYERLAS